MDSILDRYVLIARVVPTSLAISPFVLALSFIVGSGASWEALGGAVVVQFLLSMPLAQFARDAGKAVEASLWAEWGGSPVSLRLRARARADDPHASARFGAFLRTQHPPIELPSDDEERSDPGRAARLYDSVQKLLIALARDRERFPLLHAENIDYGFRRNALGLRPRAITIGVVSCAIMAGVIIAEFVRGELVGAHVVSFTAGTAVVLWWICVVKSRWVWTPADGYAARLLESVDQQARERSGSEPQR